MDRVEYSAVQEGDTVRVEAKIDDGFSFFGRGNGGANIVVSVPREIVLDLRSSNGQIRVDNVSGSVSAETSNGRVSITDSTGEEVVKTSNGRIELVNFNGQVEAETSNGAIDFLGALPPNSENVLRTSNGSIEVELLDTPGVELSAFTSNGKVRTSLPVTITGEAKEDQLEGTIGGGGSSLDLRSSNGSISIK